MVYKELNSTGTLIQRTTTEAPRGPTYYIGLDLHNKTISYCIKDASGQIRGRQSRQSWSDYAVAHLCGIEPVRIDFFRECSSVNTT